MTAGNAEVRSQEPPRTVILSPAFWDEGSLQKPDALLVSIEQAGPSLSDPFSPRN